MGPRTEPGAGTGLPSLPHVWRPFGARMAAVLFGGGLFFLCVVAWFAFPPEIRDKFTTFQKLTMGFLTLLVFSVFLGIWRSRVEAHFDTLVLINGYRRHEYPWESVVSVNLPPGAPWAVFDLADGTTRAAVGIQGSDGDRARTAVRELRTLIDRRPSPESD